MTYLENKAAHVAFAKCPEIVDFGLNDFICMYAGILWFRRKLKRNDEERKNRKGR